MNKRANTSTRLGADFISSLPDPILRRILELLTTKEAVKTCVLSKRWEHLWASARSLHFDANHFIDRNEVDIKKDDYTTKRQACLERFANFVNGVLLKREPFDLDVFRLCRAGFYWENDEQLSDWIHYAVKHRTRVFDFFEVCSLPNCIYTCTSIEELHFDYCHVKTYGTVNLPKLRKLVMESAEDSPFPNNLLSGCPVLECLELNSYLLPDEFVIAHGYLKHLSIKNCKTQRLLIDAPNLLSFSFYPPDPEFGPPREAILKTPSLIFAFLHTSCVEMGEHLGAMASMLGALSNAKILKLRIRCDQKKELHGVELQELPIFDKLKNVTVAFCAHSCFEMVAWILNSSPNLKKLTLVEKHCYREEHYREKMGATTSEWTDVSLMAAITSCRKLEIIEVKYQKGCDQMVSELVNALIDGTEELENLKIHLSKFKGCWKFFE